MTDHQADTMRKLAYYLNQMRLGNQYSDDTLWRLVRHAEDILLVESRRPHTRLRFENSLDRA